jgi:valyl-tRNA synthetase
MHLLEEHGADAARYWAVSGRPGTDTAFDPQQMKVGRRLAVKLLNASKFALADLPEPGRELTHPLDRAMIARLAAVVEDATQSFEDYDYARALARAEEFFWWFCDFYLELVKGRRYSDEPEVAASVSRALTLSLSVFQRLFAPFLPFVTEEVWSWWQEGSVHRAVWPEAGKLLAAAATGRVGLDSNERERENVALGITADVLREVRKAKSQAQVKMRAPVRRVLVRDTAERLAALELGEGDLCHAGSIEKLEQCEAGEFSAAVELSVQDIE